MADMTEAGGENTILEHLEEIYSELNSIFNSHSQRLLEFKVVISEGVKRAQEAIAVQHGRILDIMGANSALSNQASSDMDSISKFESLQSELSQQIADLTEINNQLGDAIDKLTGEKNRLSTLKKEIVGGIESVTEEIQTLNSQLDHLERDNDALKKEKAGLVKEKSMLELEVDRLKKIKDEFLTSISRYKEIKSGLMT